jgi:hypothetical protein
MCGRQRFLVKIGLPVHPPAPLCCRLWVKLGAWLKEFMIMSSTWRRSQWCQRWWRSFSSHWCGRGDVDDVEAPRAIAAADAGSLMLEPLESLLWQRRGRWCWSPLSHCCSGGGVDDDGVPRVVATTEAGSMMPEPLESFSYIMVINGR